MRRTLKTFKAHILSSLPFPCSPFLVGWLDGCLAGWLAGWMAGCLAGWGGPGASLFGFP